MKKNLLIKLNDIIVDLKTSKDKAIKKSIEFFLGRQIGDEELRSMIEEFKDKTETTKIHETLNKKNVFLRENAIIKKYNEYFRGREYEGFINETRLNIDRKDLEKLAKSFYITLLAVMSQEDSDFISKELSLENFNIISAESTKEAIIKVKDKSKGELTLISDNALDYIEAKNENIEFIGFKLDKIKEINHVNSIHEIL
jgi:hypothetical protein